MEKEKIEEQAAIYTRSCSANIRKLEALIVREDNGSPQCRAYQHGVVRVNSISIAIKVDDSATLFAMLQLGSQKSSLNKPSRAQS